MKFCDANRLQGHSHPKNTDQIFILFFRNYFPFPPPIGSKKQVKIRYNGFFPLPIYYSVSMISSTKLTGSYILCMLPFSKLSYS